MKEVLQLENKQWKSPTLEILQVNMTATTKGHGGKGGGWGSHSGSGSDYSNPEPTDPGFNS